MYVFGTFRPLVDVLATVSVGVIIYFGASFFLNGLVSLGIVIAFTNLIGRFFDPVRDLSEKYNVLQSAMAGAERVFTLLDEKSEIPQPAGPIALRADGGAVEFRHVDFGYKPDEPVIRDLSFTVAPGETVAIVGYTGAGKTTITSLLTRLYDIQGGSILLDGQDIRDLRTDDLRRRVQSVLQDVFVFSGTVEENIRLGADINQEAVLEAARAARADDFVKKLSEGYGTVLTERGANLSTGQRQLLSFARVIAHDPDVLVLDEATSNIDTETERLIQAALTKLLEGRTSLVIAHRLSTIRSSDRIVVLDRGRLVEQGTHGELLRRRGMYHTLYQMQYARQESVLTNRDPEDNK
jgi:ATP-binding cassette subfamily B protein